MRSEIDFRLINVLDRGERPLHCRNARSAVHALDGKLAESGPREGKLTKNPHPFFVGKSGFKEHFAGQMDDLMILDRALSEKEVDQLMRSQGGR